MRDYLLCYINGQPHRVQGVHAFETLSTFLRESLAKTGTKIVCEEGDCGACTVLVGRLSGGQMKYKAVNSCIQFMHQLDLAHIVTIEGLLYGQDELNPVQKAMVECHGTQCGFCTPGFVVAMCGLFDCKKKADKAEIKDALTGNLCRCTGYEPIINAGLSVEPEKMLSLAELYPTASMKQDLEKAAGEDVEIAAAGRSVYLPRSVKDAAAFRAKHPGAVIVAGGTDVCVNANKRSFEPAVMMSLCNLEGLREITKSGSVLEIGASVTLSELEEFLKTELPELAHILWVFGSPQIRNAATMAGNIANASPIADSPPALFVLDAELELASASGSRRVRINDFYKGYKKMDLKPEEMISKIFLPLPQPGEVLKLYKVSKRKHLDISSMTAAIRARIEGETIKSISIAYGGVGPVILRLPETEKFLTGKNLSQGLMRDAGEIAVKEITPISDVRGAADFRFQLARNILLKFFHEVAGEGAEACRK